MLYDMNNPSDQLQIAKFGKGYGTLLLNKWLPNISRTKNMFVIDSYEEFEKIVERLPDKFICRADAKTGYSPTLRCRRTVCTKN